MTNNQLAENSVNQLLNSVRLARDNAERADNRVDHSFYFALTIALQELQERRKADREPVGYFGRFDPDDEDLIDQCSKNVKGAFPLYRHAQPAPVVPDEREAFEAFMAKRFGDLVDQRRAKNGDHGYMAWDMVVAWTVWQARAMLQAEPVTTANKLSNSPVIPDGWKVVPVEPNGDMLAAAQDAYGETDGDIASTLRAAIAAAPQEVKP